MDGNEILNDLIKKLEDNMTSETQSKDAIDRVLAEPARSTAVVSLRTDDSIKEFQQEIAAGNIRVDTAAKVLGLIRDAITAIIAMKPQG